MKKILIIEDSLLGAQVILNILKDEGFQAVLAKDGKAGIEKALKENFDLIVTDIMLPDISGIDVCRELKTKLAAKCPKIIALTGVIDALDAVGAKKAGADDFCVKTKDMKPFLAAVKKLL